MAPKLRNRDKGNKTFDFNFVNTEQKIVKKPRKFPVFQREIV